MIYLTFYKDDKTFFGFTSKGHSNFADYGYDIVCAGVSSAVGLTLNGITRVLKIKAKVIVDENEISLSTKNLSDAEKKEASVFIEALYLQINLLEEDYKENIEVKTREV